MVRDEDAGRHRRAPQRGTGEILRQDKDGEYLARVQRVPRGRLGVERHRGKRGAAAQAFEDLLGQSHLAGRARRALIEIHDAELHRASRGLRVHRAGEIEGNEDDRDHRRRHDRAAKGRIGANALEGFAGHVPGFLSLRSAE